MKSLLCLVTVLTACKLSAAAQSSQAPPIKPILNSIGAEKPAATAFQIRENNTTIIRSHNKTYRLDSIRVIQSIKKEWISDLAVKRDTTYANPKQFNFHNTTVITLDDAAHPEAFKILKQSLIAI